MTTQILNTNLSTKNPAEGFPDVDYTELEHAHYHLEAAIENLGMIYVAADQFEAHSVEKALAATLNQFRTGFNALTEAMKLNEDK
jgi:hypothetical protein